MEAIAEIDLELEGVEMTEVHIKEDMALTDTVQAHMAAQRDLNLLAADEEAVEEAVGEAVEEAVEVLDPEELLEVAVSPMHRDRDRDRGRDDTSERSLELDEILGSRRPPSVGSELGLSFVGTENPLRIGGRGHEKGQNRKVTRRSSVGSELGLSFVGTENPLHDRPSLMRRTKTASALETKGSWCGVSESAAKPRHAPLLVVLVLLSSKP